MKSDHIKKQTAFFIAAAACIAGFLGGIVYSAFNTDPYMPGAVSEIPQQAVLQPVLPQSRVSVDMAEQIRSLEDETVNHPDDPRLWTGLGHMYFDTLQYQKAIDAYTRSLGYEPDNADVLTDLGVMYRKIGKPDKAIESFDKAVAVDPRHEIARFDKGIVLMHDLNDIPGAIDVWQSLVDINPMAMAPNGESVKMMLKNLKKRLASD
ncbi:MAG: tetratricopeptide repeat protein [Desulfobacterales bacterium]|nr:tetratricopeptide repeat protein [Desulfobacterales bacterium]MDD4073121.1 tetratricopeptide repeat protein [Desulfobacterales bacterium]MDD4391941.1 tetratricopeptide repeat protein [Desulfobacterales bacterium]